jgi:hypothetical protein
MRGVFDAQPCMEARMRSSGSAYTQMGIGRDTPVLGPRDWGKQRASRRWVRHSREEASSVLDPGLDRERDQNRCWACWRSSLRDNDA